MFADTMRFAISNYDQIVYFKIDHRENVVMAHAVDDFTIFASNSTLKNWIITEIKKIYPDITIQDERNTRDRSLQEGSIRNCRNAHFSEWSTTPLEDLLFSLLVPMPPRMSKRDFLLDTNALADRDKTLY